MIDAELRVQLEASGDNDDKLISYVLGVSERGRYRPFNLHCEIYLLCGLICDTNQSVTSWDTWDKSIALRTETPSLRP